MTKTDLKKVRAAAWKTRRKKYGERGHYGVYGRLPHHDRKRLKNMEDAIINLYEHGVLSEGQVAKITAFYRVEIRERADEMRLK